MWYHLAAFFGTLVGMYLLAAITHAIVVGVDVVREMRSTWPKLTKWQWVRVPFIFARHGLKHGLRWPYYMWLQHKRDRENVEEIHYMLREMKLR